MGMKRVSAALYGRLNLNRAFEYWVARFWPVGGHASPCLVCVRVEHTDRKNQKSVRRSVPSVCVFLSSSCVLMIGSFG